MKTPVMQQKEVEKKAFVEKGGSEVEFEKQWDERKYEAYRRRVRTAEDIHRFRCGDIRI